jgi:hypothetical protein
MFRGSYDRESTEWGLYILIVGEFAKLFELKEIIGAGYHRDVITTDAATSNATVDRAWPSIIEKHLN